MLTVAGLLVTVQSHSSTPLWGAIMEFSISSMRSTCYLFPTTEINFQNTNHLALRSFIKSISISRVSLTSCLKHCCHYLNFINSTECIIKSVKITTLSFLYDMSSIKCISKFWVQGGCILNKRNHLIQVQVSDKDILKYVFHYWEKNYNALVLKKSRKECISSDYRRFHDQSCPFSNCKCPKHSYLLFKMNSVINSTLILMRSSCLNLNAFNLICESNLQSRMHHWWKLHFWQEWG